MEQLEHIFRRSQCAWYNVGKLEEVCKKVTIAADAVSVLLQPTGVRSTVERLIRLVNEYRTFEPLFSEFYSAVRVAGTLITAIPIDQDSEMLRDLVMKTKDYAHKQCCNLVSQIFRGGQRLNPGRPFPVQRKLSDLYLELMHRDVDFFLGQINDAAWITANCSEKWSRQNVLTYLDLLIGDVQAFLMTPRRYTKENKRKVLKSTTLPNLSNARDKVKEVGTKGTLPTESGNPPTQKNIEGGQSAKNAENMEGGESAEKTREAENVENMEGGQSAEKTSETENMEERESAEEMETADTEKEANQPITDPKQLAHHLWIQFKKSLFAYRSLWMKFIFLPGKAMNRETLRERYSRMVDEQMKLSIAFDELSTSYPEGEKSPKLDLFKTDMELLFRKTHVSHQAMLKSFGDKDFADRFDVNEKELAEHAENIGKMINDMQQTESIQFEELEQHRVFVDSEICYLNNSVHGFLEDFVTACQKGYAPVHAYKNQHSKSLQLLRTCEWLKHFLSLESTVFCNNPLWSKILCDGRTLTLEMSGRSTNLSGLFAPVSRVWSFVVKNGVIKESENTPDVVNKVFRPLILVFGRQLQEDMEKVPAEMVLNLLMRKLEEPASREAVERAFHQLGLMGTSFPRNRLMSVFPADSPVLIHLLGHLPSRFEEASETVQQAPENIQKVSEQVQKVSEQVQKAPEMIQKVPEKIQKVPGQVQKAPEKIQKAPETIQKVSGQVQKGPEQAKKALVKIEVVGHAPEENSSPKNVADRTVPKVAAIPIGIARGALVEKKNAVTIHMPDVKPNIKAMSTTVVKKEVVSAPENDNIGSKHVTANCNWYINATPGFVSTTNSEVQASPRNNNVVPHNDGNTASGVVVTDWCNNVRTISDRVVDPNSNQSTQHTVGTTTKEGVNTNGNATAIGSDPQRSNLKNTGIIPDVAVNTNVEEAVDLGHKEVTHPMEGDKTATASGYDNIASEAGNIASGNDNIASGNENIASGNNLKNSNSLSEDTDEITFKDMVNALYMRPTAM